MMQAADVRRVLARVRRVCVYGVALLACAAFSVLAAPIARADIAVVDDEGNSASLEAPARRIVSLAPHATEMLFAIGAGEQVVGTVDFSDWPGEARSIPRVGGYTSIDLERVRALGPDLIVAWGSGNTRAQLARLQTLGIPMFVSEPRRIADVAAVMVRLGTLTGRAERARGAAQAFLARLDSLERVHAGRSRVRVFYQVWDRPLMTINRDQVISDAMRTCGAENVFAHLPVLVPTVDVEAVIAANPDLIATSGHANARLGWLDTWKAYPGVAAVARGNLALLPPDLLLRIGPRLVDGTAALCGAVDAARKKRGSR